MFARALLVVALLAGAEAGAEETLPFDPVGLWQFHHTDGSSFHGRLYADRTATTDFGGGERGIWRPEGEGIRILYTDGWDDLLRAEGAGFRKQSWGPGADRCGPPTNANAAERLSADPDAAIPQ